MEKAEVSKPVKGESLIHKKAREKKASRKARESSTGTAGEHKS
jgi:hypothetical protein